MGHATELSTTERALLSELQRELARLNETRSWLHQSIGSTHRVMADQLFASIRELDQAAIRARKTISNLPSGRFKEVFDGLLGQLINTLGEVRACALTLDRELHAISGGQTDGPSQSKRYLVQSSRTLRQQVSQYGSSTQPV
jgi:hypothetical protein